MISHAHIFENRTQAGAALGQALQRRPLSAPVLVLGLPRGGVPVAYEVAQSLKAPLDVMLVRKIGMPGRPELAIGAIASGNVVVHEPRLTQQIPNLSTTFTHLAETERHELERREKLYRAGLAPLHLGGKTIVLIDDGLATGCTMLAAISAARNAGAAKVIVAVPVASSEAAALVRQEADDVVILETPPMMYAIGAHYQHFEQLEDAEVCRLLERSRESLKNAGISSLPEPIRRTRKRVHREA